MTEQGLHIEREGGHIRIQGALDLAHFAQAEKALHHIRGKETTVDLQGVTRLDTAGALLLQQAKHITIEGIRPEHQALFDLVSRAKPGKLPKQQSISSFRKIFIRLGKATVDTGRAGLEFINFVGQASIKLAQVIRHPSRLRFVSIAHHIEAIGIDAIPIISLVAFVISIVLAYQGQVQLQPLGAEQYTVNLIVISVLREMGVLLTAIMIAGRSGSAFTAEIGTMQVREEVDALRSIGFDPFELLVIPRLIALVIALPLLTFIADIMGLFGGAVICLWLLDIPLVQYVEQARHVATGDDFFVGMFKAPIFAFVIALVGCMHGLKVSGSAESVGKETTASVVESIFLVLVLDGLFSIYFQKMGI